MSARKDELTNQCRKFNGPQVARGPRIGHPCCREIPCITILKEVYDGYLVDSCEQVTDIKKAFVKTSPYVLSHKYKSFMLSVDAWSKKTNAEKSKYFYKFLDQKIMGHNTKEPRKNAGKKSDKGNENDRIKQ